MAIAFMNNNIQIGPCIGYAAVARVRIGSVFTPPGFVNPSPQLDIRVWPRVLEYNLKTIHNLDFKTIVDLIQNSWYRTLAYFETASNLRVFPLQNIKLL